MKVLIRDEPRVFSTQGFECRDMGKIVLGAGEMLSMQTEAGRECDFSATSWGFYVCPSVNARLKNQGFKTALVINEHHRLFVNVVEIDKISDFKSYLKTNQNSRILCWLDEWLDEDRQLP